MVGVKSRQRRIGGSFPSAAQDADAAERLLQRVAGNGNVRVPGDEVAGRGPDRFRVLVDLVAVSGRHVVERDLPVQVVVAGKAVVVAVDMPYPVDARRFGEVAVGAEHRVLVADEPDHDALRGIGALVHPMLPGQGVQDSGQRDPREHGAGHHGVHPDRAAARAGSVRVERGRCSRRGQRGWRRQPGCDAGADKQPERNDREDEAILLVRLRGVEDQDQGDEGEQEPVAAQIAQRRRHAQCAQARTGERQPPQVLVGRAVAGAADPAQRDVEADVGEIRMEQPAVPGERIEHPDREEEHARGENELRPGSGHPLPRRYVLPRCSSLSRRCAHPRRRCPSLRKRSSVRAASAPRPSRRAGSTGRGARRRAARTASEWLPPGPPAGPPARPSPVCAGTGVRRVRAAPSAPAVAVNPVSGLWAKPTSSYQKAPASSATRAAVSSKCRRAKKYIPAGIAREIAQNTSLTPPTYRTAGRGRRRRTASGLRRSGQASATNGRRRRIPSRGCRCRRPGDAPAPGTA